MKHILLLILLFSAGFGFSQGLKDINYDSIVVIPNSSLSLVYSKKKTAVWHNDGNFFVVKPTKNYFIYLESAELLVEVDLKQKVFYGITKDDNTGGFKRFYLAHHKFEGAVIKMQNESYDVCVDSSNYNNDYTRNNPHTCSPDFGAGKISLIIDNNLLLITDYLQSRETYVDLPLASISFPGEDSIKENYDDGTIEFVYPPNEIIKGVSNSGIFDLKKRKWILNPEYYRLQKNNNKILVSVELDNNLKLLDSNYHYKMFEIQQDIPILIHDNIISNDSKVVSLMTNFDSIQQQSDQSHYISYKNGKQGLIEYQLFNTFYDNYESEPYVGWIEFYSDDVVPTNWDFIYYSVANDMLITKKDSSYLIGQYEGENLLFDFKSTVNSIIKVNGTSNNHSVSNPDANEIIRRDFTYMPFYKFGVELINDSIFIVHDILDESHDAIPLISIDYPGEDSVDVNGDVLYLAPDPGQYHSGLYNLNQNRWIIAPNEYDIQYLGGNHVLVEKPEFDNNQIIESLGYKSIYSLNGIEIKSNLTASECLNNIDFLEKIIAQENETIEPYQISEYSNTNIPDSLMPESFVYKVKNNHKEKVIEFYLKGNNFIKKELTEYHDFVLHDPKINFTFSLDTNTTLAYFGNYYNNVHSDMKEKISINNNDYELSIYTLLKPKASSLVILNVNGDSTIFQFGKKQEKTTPNLISHYLNNASSIINIKKNNNEIVYSYPKSIKGQYLDYGINDYGDDSGNDHFYAWEQEYSCIYREIDNKWIKVSPNYTSISKTPLGYICKTGLYDYQHSELWGENILDQKTINSSYILLDSALKPIGYSDFYNFDLIEDLGFGLKVCPVVDTDKLNTPDGYGNCFFINYNGTALCNAEFDDFEMVDGKIYGIKQEVIKYDEEFDEDAYDPMTGELIYLQKYGREVIGELE